MTRARTTTPGVFVDRDGTLIREVGYLSRREQIEVLPRVPEAIRLLRQQGLKVAVITNQSAVARGFITEGELQQIHRELEKRLARDGAFLDGIYYCPHHPTEGKEPYRILCYCRKPNLGLAQRAAGELNLDVARSYVVGDQTSDMELAARLGTKGILIRAENSRTGSQRGGKEFLAVNDLWEAALWVVQDVRGMR